jgi:hypothetical protein
MATGDELLTLVRLDLERSSDNDHDDSSKRAGGRTPGAILVRLASRGARRQFLLKTDVDEGPNCHDFPTVAVFDLGVSQAGGTMGRDDPVHALHIRVSKQGGVDHCPTPIPLYSHAPSMSILIEGGCPHRQMS